MADTKVEQMSVNVVKEPSMMTGAIPRKDWMDMPVTFKPGNYCYPAKISIVDPEPGQQIAGNVEIRVTAEGKSAPKRIYVGLGKAN